MNLFGEPELGIDYIQISRKTGGYRLKYAGICAYCLKPGFFRRRGLQHTYCNHKCYSQHLSVTNSGPNHYLWKGGITNPTAVIRGSAEYKEWRRQVFMRDDYTCQECGSTTSGQLEAHHLFEISERLDLFDVIENGLTMCIDCHKSIRGHEAEYREDYFIRKGICL